ncbi:GntR family transcriptional regulator [Ruegeria sp.]|uniref:GntR family transcriptional regulator n=1 Tax=Ruegeria sp. TaxID=1879320 RepID=UPI002314AFD5|nr:GntR family transcriptional regulator [Ruegeria sp.]MDA7963670.1 GntR family transcriptional regulator [Ruegeria sp.]
MNKDQDINPRVLNHISASEGALSQQVYLSIKNAILGMEFRPGQNLRKALICDQLGVSRAPVAEAITRLASEGLVDVVPQSGTRISYFSMPEIQEGVFLREALELAVVRKVTRHLTEDQGRILNRSMRLQTLLVEDDDISGFYEADEAFHELLMSFTGFDRVADVAQTVSLQVSRARRLLLPTPGRIVESLEEHRAIVDAILARNEQDAQDAMRRHLGQLMPRIELLHERMPELFNRATSEGREIA